MNFKIYLFLFLLIGLTSCGVKGPPQYDSSKEIPRWDDQFIQIPQDLSKKDKKNNSKS